LVWPADEWDQPQRVKWLNPLESGQPHAITLDDEVRGGLQAVVVVASRRPLPAYADWRHTLPALPWKRLPAAAGLVWQGNEEHLEPLDLKGMQRGKGVQLTDLGPLRETVRRLRSMEGAEVVKVLAFAVAAKDGP